MGLFFPSDPIVHGQRAKGLPRYQELLERDWKSFLFADFVTLGLCIPYGLRSLVTTMLQSGGCGMEQFRM